MRKSPSLSFILFLLLGLYSCFLFSQTPVRKNIYFPDIPGYKTLKCDFHSHTFLSDGSVSPEYRVTEAWADGLDVIAITDHIGWLAKKDFSRKEKADLYKQAYLTAKKYGITLVPGAELTRLKHPGHFNLLFIKSFGAVKDNFKMCVVRKAKKQSAVVIWNHPGSHQPGGVPVWYSMQSRMYRKGWLNGIEIANGRRCNPNAFKLAQEKLLTYFGNSDVHEQTGNIEDGNARLNRPLTLVFARDTTMNAIKDALLDRRTAVYTNGSLYGDGQYLKALFDASVKIPEIIIHTDKHDVTEGTVVQITNNSYMDFTLKPAEKSKRFDLADEMVIRANSKTELKIKISQGAETGEGQYVLKFEVKNLFVTPDQYMQVEVPVNVSK